MKDVLVFHYLPILWYRYPIPNDIREFWYTERPDILDYMQKAYKDLDIQFLPNNIITELNQQKLTATIPSFPDQLLNQSISISTEILSNINFFKTDSVFLINFINDHFIIFS
jgi:hypothetical protein